MNRKTNKKKKRKKLGSTSDLFNNLKSKLSVRSNKSLGFFVPPEAPIVVDRYAGFSCLILVATNDDYYSYSNDTEPLVDVTFSSATWPVVVSGADSFPK